jgi:D-alanyl-D-alanine dipeptidase/carboxypeptidase
MEKTIDQAGKLLLLKHSDVYRGPLILVNASHPIQAGGFPGQKGLESPAERQPDIRLETRAAALLHELIRAAGGEAEICLVSGYRTREEQIRIWEDAWKEHGETYTRKFVALPDCSEHQTGLAVDVAKRADCIDFICPEFPNEGACAEFRRLAARYGFIERYPEEKQRITGIGCEPWHFRYVGYPHAAIIKECGLCLEEYTDFLRSCPRENPFIWRDSHRSFEIFYVPASDRFTQVSVPESAAVQVSGNNADGFIVTVWR